MSELMRIKPEHPSQGEYVVIEAADFDPTRHIRVEETTDDAAPPPAEGEAPKKPKTRNKAL